MRADEVKVGNTITVENGMMGCKPKPKFTGRVKEIGFINCPTYPGYCFRLENKKLKQEIWSVWFAPSAKI